MLTTTVANAIGQPSIIITKHVCRRVAYRGHDYIGYGRDEVLLPLARELSWRDRKPPIEDDVKATQQLPELRNIGVCYAR